MRLGTLSRREVLKRAGAVVGAMTLPTIVPGSIFGQNAPSNRVNLAAIGVGGRGTGNCQRSLPAAGGRAPRGGRRLPQEPPRSVSPKMANDHYKAKVCTPYRDFRDVLARKDVDGVVISTPDHWHVPLAVFAAQAGKDMYVEKPLGVAMAWAWKLREEVAKHKVVFQYGTQQRGDQRQFRRACELVRNGYIGDDPARRRLVARHVVASSARLRSRPTARPGRSTFPPTWIMKCGSARRR